MVVNRKNKKLLKKSKTEKILKDHKKSPLARFGKGREKQAIRLAQIHDA